MKLDDQHAAALLAGELDVTEMPPEDTKEVVVQMNFPDVVLESSLGNSLITLGRVCGYNYAMPKIPEPLVPSHAVAWDKLPDSDLPTLCFTECPLAPDPFFFCAEGGRWYDFMPKPEDLGDPDYWDLGMMYRFLRDHVCNPFRPKGKGSRIMIILQECRNMTFDPFEVIRRYMSRDNFLVIGFTESADSKHYMNPATLRGFYWETSQDVNPASAIANCSALVTSSDLVVPLGLACGVPVATLHQSCFAQYGVVMDCHRNPEFLSSIFDFECDRRTVESLLTHLLRTHLVECTSAGRLLGNPHVKSWVSSTGMWGEAATLLKDEFSHLDRQELFALAKAAVSDQPGGLWQAYLNQIETLMALHGEGWSKCRRESLTTLFSNQLMKVRG